MVSRGESPAGAFALADCVRRGEGGEKRPGKPFAFRSPVTGKTKRRQNGGRGRRKRAMLKALVPTKRAEIETNSEATHE